MKKRKKKAYTLLLMALIFGAYVHYYKLNENDIALGLLSFVKRMKGDAVDLEGLEERERPKMNHEKWTLLLQKNVTEAGLVDYQTFIKEKAALREYLDQLSENVPGKNWTEEEKMAYWINAYNAFTVQLIVEHYPLNSIKDIADGTPMISSPWDIKFFKLAGVDFDLNTIEHQILRSQFKEARIHFAINCASLSCPILRNEAYEAYKLEEQLEQQAMAFIQNPEKNSINAQETKLSLIFNWFQSDFIQDTDLNSYLKKYEPSIHPSHKIEYMEYNWKLNG